MLKRIRSAVRVEGRVRSLNSRRIRDIIARSEWSQPSLGMVAALALSRSHTQITKKEIRMPACRSRRGLLTSGGVVATLLAACATTPVPGPPTAPTPAVAADSVSISATRPITEMPRRTIGFLGSGVWISNELDGGRASDVWQVDDSTFVVHNRPENAPVNSSAWYAFKVWSREPRDVHVRLTYEDGSHRYWPKVRRVGEPWLSLDTAAVARDTAAGAATLRLSVGPDTVWVAAQPLMTTSFFRSWTDSLALLPHVDRTSIGESPRGRTVHMLQTGDTAASRHVLVISRQHPPEVTGTIALVAFVEEITGNSPLAHEFRRHFRTHIVPIMNPDGVDLGHWRHNTGGVDLNRDWIDFLQPETRMVRDAFLRETSRPGAAVWFATDFHSTQRDVFYTLDRAYETEPPGVIDRWLEYIATHLPDYVVRDGPSGLGGPTSRNWFYNQYRAAAVTYEVGDSTDPVLIREVAATAARGMMEVLLYELRRAGGS
jgi:cytosolic carboxypeptidase protein 6